MQELLVMLLLLATQLLFRPAIDVGKVQNIVWDITILL
jgi:hypothetical protein